MIKIQVNKYVNEKLSSEDAIVVRDIISENIEEGIELDFEGLGSVPTRFFYSMLTGLINEKGREFVCSHIVVKNLANPLDLKRVICGTCLGECIGNKVMGV